jgi:hypothetical protein
MVKNLPLEWSVLEIQSEKFIKSHLITNPQSRHIICFYSISIITEKGMGVSSQQISDNKRRGRTMERKSIFKLIILLSLLFFAFSCTLGHLRKEEPLDEEVSQLIRSLPPADAYPNAAVIRILEEKSEEVFEDGRSRSTLHSLLKIVHEKGKTYANIKIGFNSLYEDASILYARTITPDGQILPLKRDAVKIINPYSGYPAYGDYKNLTFSLPGAAVGSVIDYKIVIEEKKPIIPGEYSGTFFFQRTDPVLVSRYKVTIPGEIDLNYLLVNQTDKTQSSPKIVHEGNRKIYLWEYKNIPQMIREDSTPPFDEIAFRILVTNMNSWDEFASWWRKLIDKKKDPTGAIKEKVISLTKNLTSIREKQESLFDYVKREVRYVSVDLGKSGFEPSTAPEVFENKYGDCKDKSTLLISMLRSAGIPAYYVLIPTNGIGNLIRDFPYPFQFNHCIVAIKDGEAYHFIDPVAQTHKFDYLPRSDQNRDVIIFEDHQIVFAKTPLPKAEGNAWETVQKVKIEKDGSIENEVKEFGSGDREAYYRSTFLGRSPIEIKESMESRVHGITPGTRLLEHSYSNPLNFKERFTIKIRYRSRGYCKSAGDLLIFELPEIWQGCSSIDKVERRYPLVQLTNSYDKNEAEFDIPEGYETYYLPEPVRVTNKHFEFHSTYRKEGEKIVYQGEFLEKAMRIPPDEYLAYQGYCQEVSKSFRREVLFRKKDKAGLRRSGQEGDMDRRFGREGVVD